MRKRLFSRTMGFLALATVLTSFVVPAGNAAAPPGNVLAWGQNTFGQLGDGS